jgi:hypothetical protein
LPDLPDLPDLPGPLPNLPKVPSVGLLLTVGRSHNSQIIYNEWNLPPQAGRVTRVADGFEFSMRTLGYLVYPFGPRTKKVVADPQITSITHWPGRHGPGWIIIAFDGDDEIMLLDPVLQDVDLTRVRYPVVAGFDDGNSGNRRAAMVERQRSIGPASWEHGRLQPGGTTSTAARRWEIAWVLGVVGAITSLLLLRG